jgi:hypothetical protein
MGWGLGTVLPMPRSYQQQQKSFTVGPEAINTNTIALLKSSTKSGNLRLPRSYQINVPALSSSVCSGRGFGVKQPTGRLFRPDGVDCSNRSGHLHSLVSRKSGPTQRVNVG